MAVDQHYTESSLLTPHSQFFTDDNTNGLSGNNNKHLSQTCPSCFTSSDFGSELSSPVDSELGSAVSDSNQDYDYIAELTRQMAHYMLQDDGNRRENEVLNSFCDWCLYDPLMCNFWFRV